MLMFRVLFLGFLCAACSGSAPDHWWQPAWSLNGRALVGEKDGPLLTRSGIEDAPVWVERCGPWRSARVVDPVLQVPSVGLKPFPKSPAVQAAVVERAGWRLGEKMGAPQGIEIGGDKATAPAEYRGIRVRSVRKTRRKGPPWMVIVGQREKQVGVLLTDKLATETYASLVLEVPEVQNLRIRTVPVLDLNGDGTQELVLYADGADGSGVRIVLNVDLSHKGSVELEHKVSQGPIDCGS